MATCSICGKDVRLGDNATVDGCDECTGVQRDKKGDAWYPGETYQTRLVSGQEKVITRKEAFA